jgi:hypothetical protein
VIETVENEPGFIISTFGRTFSIVTENNHAVENIENRVEFYSGTRFYGYKII